MFDLSLNLTVLLLFFVFPAFVIGLFIGLLW